MKHLKTYKIFESANKKFINDFMFDFGMLITMGFSQITKMGVDQKATDELSSMMKRLREPLINGKKYSEIVDDVNFLRPEENAMAYALFDCGVEEGHYFSEDWLFCDRWTKMGGEIYLDVTINLTHTGIEDYKGSYISSLV